MNTAFTCATVLLSLYAHASSLDDSSVSGDTNNQSIPSKVRGSGKITSFLLDETNPSNTFTLPSIPGLPLPDNINELEETPCEHLSPTELKKRTYSELQGDSQQDSSLPAAKKRKTSSSSYSHLNDEQKESIKQYIHENPGATGKDISEYANKQLMVELNTAAANNFKTKTIRQSRSYSHLNDTQKESLKKYIHENPGVKGKDISQYATDHLGVELDNVAASRFKTNVNTPSQSFSHLNDAQKKSIKKYIFENPSATGKAISEYATDHLGVELNSAAAIKFKINVNAPSSSYNHLNDAQKESIKKYINENPDATGKDISEYATKQLMVGLNTAAAHNFKIKTIRQSQSRAHLNDAQKESIKKYIHENPSAKGKDISQYATDHLGVELNSVAAIKFKINVNTPSQSYSHLNDAQKESIKQYIHENPGATGKDISEYANKKLMVELNTAAANNFKAKTIRQSRSYSYLNDAQKESLKKYIHENPSAKSKDISKYATDHLGVKLNTGAAYEFKNNITYTITTKK